jgi:SAM-dependent methyltransferase
MTQLPLRDAFQRRENRFRLLDRGIALTGWSGKELRILEIGCANGAAARHVSLGERFDLWAADLDGDAINTGAEGPLLHFLRADARALPFEAGSFDGIYCEAAFSVIPEKAAAVSEYARVLKPGGRVLLNDFIIRGEPQRERQNSFGIPCFDGVGTMESYIRLFSLWGMSCVYSKEHYFELLGIGASLSRSYRVTGAEISGFIARNFGSDGFVGDFFAKSRMSYAQLIFEKEHI